MAAELSEGGRASPSPPTCPPKTGAARLADEIAAASRPLDILVNNAGATWGTPLADFDEAAFERVLALNVKGVFHLTKFLVPAAGGGRHRGGAGPGHQHRLDRRHPGPGARDLLVLGLQGGGPPADPAPGQAPGAAVTVNAIAPGPFESKMMAATLDAFGEQIAASAPLKRIGRPDDMAGTAIFLSSRAGAYLTGAVIPVDGGIATTH